MEASLIAVVATIIVAMLGWIVAEQRAVRGEVRGLSADVAQLRERMAKLEGMFEQFTGSPRVKG